MKDIPKILLIFAIIVIGYFLYINLTNNDVRNVDENFIGRIGKLVREPFTDGATADTSAESVDNSVSVVSSDASNASSNSTESSVVVPNNVVAVNDPIPEIKAVDVNDPTIKGKLVTKNTAMSDEVKRINYADGVRGNFGNSEWMQYFDQVSDLTNNIDQYKNDNFQPNEAPNNAQAMQRLYNKKGLEKPEDMFDADKFLPKDIRDDWFEVMPEPISVKNRHLINITRSIGINTIGSSLRNPSLDIRGAPSNPKFTVSPWCQSTIEPDINIKPVI